MRCPVCGDEGNVLRKSVRTIVFNPFCSGWGWYICGSFLCVVWPHDADPDARQGELFRGVGNLGRRQHFLLEKDSRISIEESSIRRNHGTLYKIVVEQPGGKPFEFGTGIEEAEARQYIAALLRQMRE